MKKMFIVLSAILLQLSVMHASEEEIVLPAQSPHQIVPYFSFKAVKEPDFTNKIFHMGLGYRYTQDSGYNARLNLSLANAATYSYNGELEFENSYVLTDAHYFDLAPFITWKTEIYGTPKLFNEKNRRVEHSTLHGGVAVIKKVNPDFTISYHPSYSHDIMRNVSSKFQHNVCVGVGIKKLKGVHHKVRVNYQLSDRCFLELEPEYHHFFKNKNIEKGAKFSFIWMI